MSRTGSEKDEADVVAMSRTGSEKEEADVVGMSRTGSKKETKCKLSHLWIMDRTASMQPWHQRDFTPSTHPPK